MEQGQFIFLGTGSSMGVPVIGCRCLVCTSNVPYNKRLRPAGLIMAKGIQLLIDAGPDLREQALRQQIESIDGLLLTHAHFDHIGGLDDLRPLYFAHHKKTPCLLSQETMGILRMRLPHLFAPMIEGRATAAQIEFDILPEDFGSIHFAGLRIHYLSFHQSGMKVTGFRLNQFAYVSDIYTYTPEVLSALKGVEVLVLSALRETTSYAHFSIEQAIAFASQVGAKRTWLTHIAHELDHEETNKRLPSHIQLGYDGLSFKFDL